MSEIKEKWITLREAAQRLRISYGTARNLWPNWKNHGVNAYKINRRVLFDIEQIDLMVKKNKVN